MECLVRVDQRIINKNNPDNFALQRIFKELGVGYEYLVGNSWTAGAPVQKPEGKRIIFDDVDRFRAARDVYFAWQDLTVLKVDSPVKPEVIIQRLIKSRATKETLILFVPWGMRTEGQPELEKIAMRRIQSVEEKLRTRGINAQTLIMPADLYATEVNNQVSRETAEQYFPFITQIAIGQGFKIKPWSEIRAENAQIYTKLAAQLTPEEIRNLLKQGVITRALDAASRRSGYFSESDIERSAFAYLRERICEAEIVEDIYKPVKVSVVSKSKDTGVDRDLPRLYIIPENLQFPWLK